MTENASPSFPTTQAPTKFKRHSLNIISPGPRPLQLASGSVLSSPSNSPSRSPALHNSSAHSSPGPLSPFGPRGIKNGRRQSSISYLPSANRDKDSPTSLLPSPLSPTGVSRGIAVRSGNSVAAGSADEMDQGSKMAVGATNSVTLDASKQLKGRPPATLAEKHAELLHFIAQKESKCLELRSQLATHEAELLQLKRKWERIVNRGFEKTSSSSFPSLSIPSTASSHTTSAAGSSGVVLEGIKEGVQGMSRFLTAGLGSIAQGNTPVSSSTGALSLTTRGNRRVSSKFPVPLRLGSGSNHGHESQSSSSTSTSATTVASSSTSATSSMLEQTLALSPPFTPTSDEASIECDEFGDYEEAHTGNLNELAEQEENLEQVLMVHDTGATPTMSPNPYFKRRGRMDVKQNDPACEVDSGWGDEWIKSGALTADNSIDDFMNPGSQIETLPHSPVTHTVQPFPTKSPKIKTPSLPGVSSIPGLASSSMSMNGPTPQSMSTWVDSVGKKWGEIRESQTFTKSQKRASVLLSGVSQSIVSALVSPSSLSPSPRSGTASKSPLENPSSSNAILAPSPSTNAESTIRTNKNEAPMLTSLLDDLDIGEVDEALKLVIGSPVLVPDQASQKNSFNPTKIQLCNVGGPGMNNLQPPSNSFDDEDWNW